MALHISVTSPPSQTALIKQDIGIKMVEIHQWDSQSTHSLGHNITYMHGHMICHMILSLDGQGI